MKIDVIAFGKIADITARSSWQMEGVQSTEALRQQLEAQYPALQGMPYKIAVDKQIAASDAPIHDGAEIALLPPFSGG